MPHGLVSIFILGVMRSQTGPAAVQRSCGLDLSVSPWLQPPRKIVHFFIFTLKTFL